MQFGVEEEVQCRVNKTIGGRTKESTATTVIWVCRFNALKFDVTSEAVHLGMSAAQPCSLVFKKKYSAESVGQLQEEQRSPQQH